MGFEITLSCDLLIAADHIQFALQVPLGIVPDAGALQRLPEKIPYNIAMEMFLLGRRLNVKEALNFGLINKTVKFENLMESARSWA